MTVQARIRRCAIRVRIHICVHDVYVRFREGLHHGDMRRVQRADPAVDGIRRHRGKRGKAGQMAQGTAEYYYHPMGDEYRRIRRWGSIPPIQRGEQMGGGRRLESGIRLSPERDAGIVRLDGA